MVKLNISYGFVRVKLVEKDYCHAWNKFKPQENLNKPINTWIEAPCLLLSSGTCTTTLFSQLKMRKNIFFVEYLWLIWLRIIFRPCFDSCWDIINTKRGGCARFHTVLQDKNVFKKVQKKLWNYLNRLRLIFRAFLPPLEKLETKYKRFCSTFLFK